jgi:LPXTG-site transpeptidase (sortase) family protein
MRRLVAIIAAGTVLLAGCGTALDEPIAPPIVDTTPAPGLGQVPDPVSVQIPRIGVDAPLVPTGRTPEGAWEVPSVAADASWYQPGPEPGETGVAVLLGHVDLNGEQGVFGRLHELGPGDEIVVPHPDGATRWTVAEVLTRPKAEFNVQDVLSPEAEPELVLITCGGNLTRTERGGRYEDNVVVVARLSG